jgi:hypothetical protein
VSRGTFPIFFLLFYFCSFFVFSFSFFFQKKPHSFWAHRVRLGTLYREEEARVTEPKTKNKNIQTRKRNQMRFDAGVRW